MFNAICRRHCLHLAPAKRRYSAQVRFLSYSAICRDASRQPSLPPHKHSRTLPAYIQRQQQLVALQSRPELTVEDFEDFARRGEGSIEQAEACLYHLKNQLLQLPLQKRHEKCLQHNAGKRILLWYWNRRASYDPTPNRTFAHLLTCLAMFAQHAPPQRPFVFLGLTVAVEQAIQEVTHPSYDPTLWDSYYHNLPRFLTDEGILRQAQSVGRLYHPSKADGLDFYEFLQWLGRNGDPQVWSARSATKNSFTMKVLRASYVLRLQGHDEKAQWLQDQAEMHNAGFCSSHYDRVSKEFDLDPKLELLRQRASVSRFPDFR
ncbi:hypothetical protein HII31_05006, partial [Pseudocercospora fuligena]